MLPTPALPLDDGATAPGGGDNEGGMISGVYNSDEPAEVWPLVGRGIPHVQRSVASTEDAADDAGGGELQHLLTNDVESVADSEVDLHYTRRRTNISVFVKQQFYKQ